MAESVAHSASKFGVIGFTEAVGLEVRRSGVKVSAVEPGPVQTTFSESTTGRDRALRPDDVARVGRAVLATGSNVWIRRRSSRRCRSPRRKRRATNAVNQRLGEGPYPHGAVAEIGRMATA